jgi:hypothetical protein
MASYAPIFDNDDLEKKSLQSIKSASKTTKKSNYGSLRVEQPQQTKQTSTAFIVNYKHRLMPGETLLGISLKYGISVSELFFSSSAYILLFLIIYSSKKQKQRLIKSKKQIVYGVMI